MTGVVSAHENYVADRFDRLEARFKAEVGHDDFRLRALVDVLETHFCRVGQRSATHQTASARAVGCASLTHPTKERMPVRLLRPLDALRILDLGCGKGRFATRLQAMGAQVIGLDLSAAMLSAAHGLDRVRASARRLPFREETFDAVVAVEIFEHLPREAIAEAIDEARRVLRPGGVLALIDKNAGSWDARRPYLPNLAIKWLDERRGRWMYPAGGPVRERWFWPSAMRRQLARRFDRVEVAFPLAPDEAGSPLFRLLPHTRRFALWTARTPGDTP